MDGHRRFPILQYLYQYICIGKYVALDPKYDTRQQEQIPAILQERLYVDMSDLLSIWKHREYVRSLCNVRPSGFYDYPHSRRYSGFLLHHKSIPTPQSPRHREIQRMVQRTQ